MLPWQQRVVDEKRELDDRIVKLTQFICSSPIFASLHHVDQALMRDQRDFMLDYSDVLAQRIKLFNTTEEH